MTIATPRDNLGEPYQAVIRIDDDTGQWCPKLSVLSQELQERPDCPIIIDWTTIDPRDYETFPDPRAHAALLLEHLHRWQEISIYVNYMPLDCFSSIRGTACRLETVLIEAPKSKFDAPQYSQHISYLWAKAPKFRSYSIKHCNEYASRSQEQMSALRLPYSNFTTLRIDTVLPLDECITILAAAKQLLHCRFGSIAAPNTPPSTSRLIHQSLQSLFIVSNWDDHVRDLKTFAHCLLNHVQTPALRRLVVENDSHWDPALFEQFVADSRCNLEALEFHMVKVHGHQLFATLRTYCPNIRVFKIYADKTQNPPPISRTAWERLRYEGDAQVFLPKLTLLFVNEEALVDAAYPDGELAAVVHSRLNKGLQVVWFQTDNKEKSLNACSLKNMFPPGDVRSHWDLKHLVIDEDAQPEFWNDCVQEYMWPTGYGWRPPPWLDEEDMEDDEEMSSDSDEDNEDDTSDMDCD
ncbi:hypothetical protein D9619_009797 [Psilocybe cf. subviscida]|uniref:Uncharacterized protein n=1 Tax=Psilocybe cf. subviscida TaxID=2480587 RepID=A0A8H5F6I1_9AGAR|nr:hypothetical protein D9619_009797 [Psilocybe cf. subviscida]